MSNTPTVDGLVKEAMRRCRERIKSGEKRREEPAISNCLKKKWL